MKSFGDYITERVEISGKKREDFEKSILKTYPRAEFEEDKMGDIQAYVDTGKTKVPVGSYDPKRKKGYKFDKPNVKGS